MKTAEMKAHLRKLLNKYISYLEKVEIQIEFLGSYAFTTCDSKNKAKIEKIEKKDFIIYVIKTKEELTEEEAVKGYKYLKYNKETKYGTFRVNNEKNDNHFDFQKNSPEKCLYVGSSQDIRKRLKEHLGINGDKTFALHLSKWWENKEITIDLYEVTTNAKEMQLYEDRLWEGYKPLLGKQGKK